VELDPALREAVLSAYAGLGRDVPVAVRSSAVAEDSEAASFAGQQETFLHVRGSDDVRARIRDCWASFFSERALFYRSRKGSLGDLGMAVVVQRMVDADIAGVLFTCDPVRRRRDRMVVEAVIGLGEAAVSGAVTPDHYVIKRDGRVRREYVHEQPYAIVAGEAGGVVERPLAPEEGGARKVGDALLEQLARLGDDLEQRVGVPQDIEWAVQDGELYVLQARPVTA
jgi:pyruvate,water dikinase